MGRVRFVFSCLYCMFFLFFGSFAINLFASAGEKDEGSREVMEEQQETEDVSDVLPDLGLISKGFGNLIGKQIGNLGIQLQEKDLIQGIQDGLVGSPSPISESKCIHAVSILHGKAMQELSDKNLETAEQFLEQNLKNPGIVALEDGKIQYYQLQEGSGISVEDGASPLLRYVGKFIDGRVFGESKGEEVISLGDTIEGFQRGVIGMKEGEKRRIYIHPSLGYGLRGELDPNALLQFDVELVKANVAKADVMEEVAYQNNEIVDDAVVQQQEDANNIPVKEEMAAKNHTD